MCNLVTVERLLKGQCYCVRSIVCVLPSVSAKLLFGAKTRQRRNVVLFFVEKFRPHQDGLLPSSQIVLSLWARVSKIVFQGGIYVIYLGYDLIRATFFLPCQQYLSHWARASKMIIQRGIYVILDMTSLGWTSSFLTNNTHR